MSDLGPALTLGQMVDRAAARFPDRTAIVFKDERISYADLKRRADEALDPEEIVAFASGKIANFKVPKYVEIVDRFPLTGSGKVQKFKQKAYAVEKYALGGP